MLNSWQRANQEGIYACLIFYHFVRDEAREHNRIHETPDESKLIGSLLKYMLNQLTL